MKSTGDSSMIAFNTLRVSSTGTAASILLEYSCFNGSSAKTRNRKNTTIETGLKARTSLPTPTTLFLSLYTREVLELCNRFSGRPAGDTEELTPRLLPGEDSHACLRQAQGTREKLNARFVCPSFSGRRVEFQAQFTIGVYHQPLAR